MPAVFITYRQLDATHKQRVRRFAERLRTFGIDVVLDQFFQDENPGGSGDTWAKWSSDQAIDAERILIIASDTWFRCYDGTEKPGTGLGAACEARVIRQRIYDHAGVNRFVRVAFFDEADVAKESCSSSTICHVNTLDFSDRHIDTHNMATVSLTPAAAEQLDRLPKAIHARITDCAFV